MSKRREWKTRDSGAREEYESGAVREPRTNKGRYELLSPLAIRRLAAVYERGALKYGARNYEQGEPLSRYVDSALRHIFQFLEGMQDEDHAAHAAWNLMALLHTEEAIRRGILPQSLVDLPSYPPTSSDGKDWR